jgi:hypothetical protein
MYEEEKESNIPSQVFSPQAPLYAACASTPNFEQLISISIFIASLDFSRSCRKKRDKWLTRLISLKLMFLSFNFFISTKNFEPPSIRCM